MGTMKQIAFIFHTYKNLGDHGEKCREVALFNEDATIADLLLFINQREGSLELTRQVEPVCAKHESDF